MMKKILFLILCIFMITPSASAQSWGNFYQRPKKQCHQPRYVSQCNYQQPYYPQYSGGTMYPQQWGYAQRVVVQNYGGNWSPYTGYQYTSYNNIQQYGQQNLYSGQYSNGHGMYQTQQWGYQQYGNTYYAPRRPNFAQLGMAVEMAIQSFDR
jgi:hypothetical protein